MAPTRRASTAHALRALAAPLSVLSLVVLVLNDHVLKQAWPGLVTGKLSDFAGLVVAPLLLAVLLAAVGVRRALPVAIGLTGLGFVFAKTSIAGAAATSAVWSLTGIPTLIRADVTDLVALPTLGLAWWVDRRVRRSADLPWRRVTSVALGMAVLPVAVLGTAATSCDEGTSLTEVSRVEADFAGRPRQLEQRLVIGVLGSSAVSTLDASGISRREAVQFSEADQSIPEQCDPVSPDECWRILPEGVVVEHSTDGGATWESELHVSDDELEQIAEDHDDCVGSGRIGAYDLGVLPTEGEPIVVVPIGKGGAYLRERDASWTLHPVEQLFELYGPMTRTTPTRVTPLDQPVEVAPPPPPRQPTEVRPTCSNPTPTTVTPDPRNGPPTTYLTCP